MPQPLTTPRRTRALPAPLLAALAVLALFVLIAAGSAAASRLAASPNVPAPPVKPTSASQIQNIDQVKTAIKGYYGDTTTTTLDPYTGTKVLHEPSPTGNYAAETRSITGGAKTFLDDKAPHGTPAAGTPKPAIVLDVDDTSLVTYDYEIYSNFVYDPTSSAAFVNNAQFPAVFGMPSLAARAVHDGYTVFFLTGRPETQRDGTTTNLANAGYPAVPADHLYLKDQVNQPWLSSCSPTCTTIQYKSLTRAHIESLGYTIYANFGDQFSDLAGGYAKKTYKMPNPMYYLP